MQYNVGTPKQYLAALEIDWRKEKLQQLRALILKQDSDICESVNYGMLCFSLGDTTIFHLNAQRGYVSLYCGNIEKIDRDRALLAGLSQGKGCVRFTKTSDILSESVVEFIRKAVALGREGVDLDC